MGPKEQLAAIHEVVPGLIEIKGQLFQRVSALLAQEGIQDLGTRTSQTRNRVQADDYFRSAVLPILSPQIVGSAIQPPHLDNKALYITALLSSKSGKKVPGLHPPARRPAPHLPAAGKPRAVPAAGEHHPATGPPKLFGKYVVEETCVISATRNADLTFDTEKFEDREEDFRQLMTKMLKKRANQAIVRLELGQKPSQTMMDLLTGMIPVVTGQVYYDSSPLAMGYVSQLEKLLPEELRAKLTYVPYQPRWPENLNRQESMIDQIRFGGTGSSFSPLTPLIPS